MRHDLLYGNIRLLRARPLRNSPTRFQSIWVPLCGRDNVEFTNENLFVKLRFRRGQDCYIIQTSIPVHRNLMELLIMTQTLRLDPVTASQW